MVVVRVKWENQRKEVDYDFTDEFWDKLVAKAEVTELCNRIVVNPNKLMLHNTDEMVEWVKENCPNEEFKSRFCNRSVVLGTVIKDMVLVERIFVKNSYTAPVHKIEDGYVWLYKKGRDWCDMTERCWSETKTYKVKCSDRALLRLPLLDQMGTAKEMFATKDKKIAYAYVSVMAETGDFIVQHLFKDIFEENSWVNYQINTEYLYRDVIKDE